MKIGKEFLAVVIVSVIIIFAALVISFFIANYRAEIITGKELNFIETLYWSFVYNV